MFSLATPLTMQLARKMSGTSGPTRPVHTPRSSRTSGTACAAVIVSTTARTSVACGALTRKVTNLAGEPLTSIAVAGSRVAATGVWALGVARVSSAIARASGERKRMDRILLAPLASSGCQHERDAGECERLEDC